MRAMSCLPFSRRLCLPAILVLTVLTAPLWAGEPRPYAGPPRPLLVEPGLAPRAANILGQIGLSYAPGLTPRERERDFLQNIARAKELLGLGRPVELRHRSLALINAHGREPSWDFLRGQRWPNGDRIGVTLSAPVWVPATATRVVTYCGFERKWQTVAQNLPRPSGYVWFASRLADINNKAAYRPECIHVEVHSQFAPLAALLLEYIFREGWYEPAKRLPLMVVRGGEDTYAASAYTPPVVAECLSFPDDTGTSLEAEVVAVSFANLAELHHGRHSAGSNHRLGLALDLNDFNFKGVTDGPPNPISQASRQYNRGAMHALDARHLPAWVYRAAKWLGLRLPQEWIYYGYHTDWAHIDVGTK
jgi:hypothetical protein